MDAFTTARTKIAVPTLASGAIFQQPVSNLDVKSNVDGIVNGAAGRRRLSSGPITARHQRGCPQCQ